MVALAAEVPKATPFETNRKRSNRRRNTPMERNRDIGASVPVVHGADKRREPQSPVTPPDFSPAPLSLPPELVRQQEILLAWCSARRLERWMLLCGVNESCKHTDSGVAELTAIYVESWLIASIQWPALAVIAIDDEPEEIWSPRDEEDALAMGLTIIRRPERTKLAPPSLPGCAGTINGKPCLRPRRAGERFCPSCRKAALAAMRAAHAEG